MSRERDPRLPDPPTRPGAMFYAIAGALVSAAVPDVLGHVHLA
jgi:hypothetical protein